jgi:NADH:ubiquinone reductase (H+-translocating)
MSSEADQEAGEAGRPYRRAQAHEQADVVVLGASFAGIEVVLQLARRTEGRGLSMIVIDRQAEHGYIPLVQERLCEIVSVDETRLDTRAFVDSLPNARFVQGEITGFDVETKTVRLASGDAVQGRFIVVALGSELSPPRDLAGREHLLSHKGRASFDRARAALDDALRGAEAPSIVVIGGGISGIELAAELGALRDARPQAWPHAPKVTLVSAADRLAPELTPGVGRRAEAVLRRLDVEVRLGARVEGVTEDAVTVRPAAGDRIELPYALAFWAGGVRPAPILDVLELPRTDDGWLAVGPTLQCFPTPTPKRPDIFACGDAVRIIGGEGRWRTMQRAIECIWQAKVVARNVHTLSATAPEYPEGVPPLHPHRLRESFYYGVSLGPRSLVVRGPLVLDLPGVNHWFRRWLMRRYFARYAPLRG